MTSEHAESAQDREEALGLARVADQRGQAPGQQSLHSADQVHRQPEDGIDPATTKRQQAALAGQHQGQNQRDRDIEPPASAPRDQACQQQRGQEGGDAECHVEGRQVHGAEAGEEERVDGIAADAAAGRDEETEAGEQGQQPALASLDLQNAEEHLHAIAVS